jgi:hypothetical protein
MYDYEFPMKGERFEFDQNDGHLLVAIKIHNAGKTASMSIKVHSRCGDAQQTFEQVIQLLWWGQPRRMIEFWRLSEVTYKRSFGSISVKAPVHIVEAMCDPLVFCALDFWYDRVSEEYEPLRLVN